MGFSRLFSPSHKRASSVSSVSEESAQNRVHIPLSQLTQPSSSTVQSSSPNNQEFKKSANGASSNNNRLSFHSTVPMSSVPSKHVRLRVHIDVPSSSPFTIEVPLASTIPQLKQAIYDVDLTRGPSRIFPGLTGKGKVSDLAHMRLYSTTIPWEAWYQSKVYSDFHERRVHLLVHFPSVLLLEDETGPKNVGTIWGPDSAQGHKFFGKKSAGVDTSKGEIHILVRVLPFGSHTLTVMAFIEKPLSAPGLLEGEAPITPDTPTYPVTKEERAATIATPLSPTNSDDDPKSQETKAKNDYITPVLVDVDSRATVHTLKFMLLGADGRASVMLDRVLLTRTDIPFTPTASMDRFALKDEPLSEPDMEPLILRDSSKKVSEYFPLPAMSSVTDRVQILVSIHPTALPKLSRSEELNHIPPFAYPAPMITRSGLKAGRSSLSGHSGSSGIAAPSNMRRMSSGAVRKSISLGDIRMLNSGRGSFSKLAISSTSEDSPPNSTASSVYNVPYIPDGSLNGSGALSPPRSPRAARPSINGIRTDSSDSDSILRKLAVVNLAKNRPSKISALSESHSGEFSTQPTTLIVDDIDVDEDFGFAI